ncbi:protein NRT1/ PTR FAMILY 2.13-like isoform X1 [Arachis stenosperma]|uniref:protein NRT1/ PTR FAMILY 2.13-like isoform X1 n=2 Tax=Arachis stenosperma TaxID=217475 RepID=UPI0025AD41A2|nr:protein NRT1/ PTR FAMILY 2.13-like isoform X1 [Arachis stenosperma]
MIEKISSSESSSATKTNKKYGGWKAVPFILGNETFERLAVFGLLLNFMVYLTTQLHLNQVSASNVMNIWFGLTNFGPLLGAFISDAFFGRFRTIAFASFSSLLGMVLVFLTSWLPELHPPSCTAQELAKGECVKASNSQMGVVILGLCFLTIGSAGIRPCSIPFGVDQFDQTTEEGKKGMASYFNWYYTTFTLVLLVSQTLVIYVQTSISWKIGFAIPTVCMFLSIIMLFVGTRLYVYVKPEGSTFPGIGHVLVAAYRKRKLMLPIIEDKLDGVFYDPPLISASSGDSLPLKLPLTQQFRALNKAALIMEGDLNEDKSIVNKWRLTSIQQVEEVKCIARVLPILFTSIIPLIALLQQGTFNVTQALKMDRNLGPKFQVPAGSIGVISYITIALWLPFYDRILVPRLRKMTNQEGGITLLLRIGIGNVFSILSMVVAGLVEKLRRDSANSHQNPLGIAPISVFYLAPQLVLMGMCEAFSAIGLIEIFNREFPENMRSVGNSLFPFAFGCASYVSAIIVNIVHHVTGTHSHPDWLTNDINAGRIDYFYYIIAGLGVINMVYFIHVATRYQYKKVQVIDPLPQDMEMGSHKT